MLKLNKLEGMVSRIYPPELQLNKANASDTEALFLDLHLSISNWLVSSKIYDKRDDFVFDIVNLPFFWIGTFPVLPLTVCTFLNLFDLLECLVMWLTLMHVIKSYLVKFSFRGIGIINFEKVFQSFIADTINWFQNSKSD